MNRKTVVALAGRPNTGKTTLFNALTGMRQRVANFSGTTVEKAVGTLVLEGERQAEIIDLPGTASLIAATADESVAFEFLSASAAHGARLHVLCVAEASNLENDLPFALSLRDCGYPVTLVVNMADEAALNGIRIDRRRLESAVKLPVILCSARTGQGIDRIHRLIAAGPPAARAEKPLDLSRAPKSALQDIHEASVRHASEAARAAVERADEGLLPTVSRSIALDRWLFSPLFGPLILALVMFTVFQALFTWATPARDAISNSLLWLSANLRPRVGPDFLAGFFCDGVIPGISAVAQFVPQIAILFLLIGILEQSGYLPRAAAMVDRALRPFGLDGKVFIPFLSSFACAIPGIMATRTITGEKRRLKAIFLAPLMTCSARLPVYTLIIGAFIPASRRIFGLGAQGLVMAGMYVFGIVMALIVASALRWTDLEEKRALPVTVLPPYRFPKIKDIARYVAIRCWHFLSRAGRVIFAVSVFLWVMSRYPGPGIEQSALGMLGRAVEPLFAPLGYDWRISIAVISSIAAREVFVGTLGTILALGSGASSLGLTAALQARYALPTAVSLLIFFAIAMQCISTIAVVRRETGGWKWPAIQFATYFSLAYALAWAGYHLTAWLA